MSHHKKLYIEDFYYNVDEDYDKIIKNIDKLESRTKIYRKEDFKNFIKKIINSFINKQPTTNNYK